MSHDLEPHTVADWIDRCEQLRALTRHGACEINGRPVARLHSTADGARLELIHIWLTPDEAATLTAWLAHWWPEAGPHHAECAFRTGDATGHLFRCARVEGQWSCPVECAVTRAERAEAECRALKAERDAAMKELAELKASLRQWGNPER